MLDPDDLAPLPDGVVWSVGEVAASLGLPTSTVRTWERRYGLAPTARTSGGHRRYSADDVERMRLMRQLVDQGVSPSEAARSVLQAARVARARRVDTDIEGVESWIEHVVHAARVFDVSALRELLQTVIGARGVLDSWDLYFSPMLRRVGEEWSAGNFGIDSEHLVSEAVLNALRAHVHGMERTAGRPVVILASAEDDQHSLPVLALQAALAESGLDAHAFGARLPAAALASVVARTQPRAVFLWASLKRPRGDRLHRVLTALAGQTTIVLGGPGWHGGTIAKTTVTTDLASTVAALSGTRR